MRATGSATLPAPTAAVPSRACAPVCQQQPRATKRGSNPPHPQRRATSPPHPIPPPEFTDPRSTYRLRTSSGSEMAREASVGTRAGAVRAGILETAAETAAPAAEAALAFRAETNGEGR